MNKNDVIRAWKDPAYRASLSEEEQAALPLNPAGIADLSDDQLRIGPVRSGTGLVTRWRFFVISPP